MDGCLRLGTSQRWGLGTAPPSLKSLDPATFSAALSDQQTHPLYESDRAVVDRLLAAAEPADADLVDAARLLNRYQGFPGASDIQEDLAKAVRLWGLDREQLQARTRAIWAAGFRPMKEAPTEAVGSSFDTTEQD